MHPEHARLASAALFIFLSINGCLTSNPLPATQTDGSHSKLPDSSSRVVVWGNHQEAVKSLKTWLSKQGYIVVDELKISQLAKDNQLPMPVSNTDLLKLSKTAGAKEVIFVDADVITWKMPEVLDVFGQSTSAYKASLYIRALNPETGETDWNGSAITVEKFPDLVNGIHRLTCNALATSWGLRKPGITAPANICPNGQNVMVLNEIPSPSKEVATSSNNTEPHTPTPIKRLK